MVKKSQIRNDASELHIFSNLSDSVFPLSIRVFLSELRRRICNNGKKQSEHLGCARLRLRGFIDLHAFNLPSNSGKQAALFPCNKYTPKMEVGV